jgi:hypothetical protein
MTLPNFLIIGAMKAGTTTLYDVLQSVPGLWFPPQKEPEDLIDPRIEEPGRLAEYESKYARCPAGALAGDASTAYAKRPTHEGVAERACRLLGPQTRIIYMTRHPVQRIVSQYHHLWGLQMEQRPLARAVLEDPQYVGYSRYSWQLEPWLQTFGPDNVLVIRFEDYLADQAAVVAQVCDFLGVPVGSAEFGTSHRNKSEGKRVAREGSLMKRFAGSRFYLFTIKPLLSSALRDRLKAMVLPRARKMEEKLDGQTREELVRRLMEDPLASAYLG